jgi:hypothetical protein
MAAQLIFDRASGQWIQLPDEPLPPKPRTYRTADDDRLDRLESWTEAAINRLTSASDADEAAQLFARRGALTHLRRLLEEELQREELSRQAAATERSRAKAAVSELLAGLPRALERRAELELKLANEELPQLADDAEKTRYDGHGSSYHDGQLRKQAQIRRDATEELATVESKIEQAERGVNGSSYEDLQRRLAASKEEFALNRVPIIKQSWRGRCHLIP